MYLSYSGDLKHEDCSYAYWNEYVNRTPLEEEKDCLGSIYGSASGIMFERFYKEEIWRKDQPQAYLSGLIEGILDGVIQKETTSREIYPGNVIPGGVLKWKGYEGATYKAYKDKAEIIADMRDTVARGFRTIKHYRLLGSKVETETKLDSIIDGHKIAGRSDFIMRRASPYNDLLLGDGKGSRNREYANKRQLLWYSMLLREQRKILPDQLAFIYWRFEPPGSVDMFDVVPSEVDDLLEKVIATASAIESKEKLLGKRAPFERAQEVFKPNPSKSTCRYCPYGTEAICPKGAELKKKVNTSERTSGV